MQFNETFMFAAVICVIVIWLLYNQNNSDNSCENNSECPNGVCEVKTQATTKCSDKNKATNQITILDKTHTKEVEPHLDLTDLPKEYPNIYLPDMQEDSNSYSYPVATR